MEKKKDGFAQWYIDNFGEDDFYKYIDHEENKKNGIDIWKLSKRSLVELCFICKNKDYHKYYLSCDKFYRGNRCRYCGRTKFVHPLDSFGQYIINNYGEDFLNLIWSDKNEKSPFEYTLGSEQKVWFNCEKGLHKPRLRQIRLFIRSDCRCAICNEDSNISILENKVYTYLNTMDYTILKEHNCTIRPMNPKTKLPLPYDNEIVELKLIIEVHGRQHFELLNKSSKWLEGLTPKEYLKYRKLKDRYKRIYAKSKGYHYLEIPYWEIKNDNWKRMIDDKIKSIKGNND